MRFPVHPTRGLILPLPAQSVDVSGMRDLLLFELMKWDAKLSYGNQVTIPQGSVNFFSPSDRPVAGATSSRRNVRWYWVDSRKVEMGYIMWTPQAHSFRLSTRRLRSMASVGDILVLGKPKVSGAYQIGLISKGTPDHPAYLAYCHYRAPAHGKRWGYVYGR